MTTTRLVPRSEGFTRAACRFDESGYITQHFHHHRSLPTGAANPGRRAVILVRAAASPLRPAPESKGEAARGHRESRRQARRRGPDRQGGRRRARRRRSSQGDQDRTEGGSLMLSLVLDLTLHLAATLGL